MVPTLKLVWSRTLETARLMVGVPDYDAYLVHMHAEHPERTPLTRPEFVRAAQEARYNSRSGGRCC